MTIYDSAPSENVHAELRRKLHVVWPSLGILKGHCARQQRYSEDCGVHMTANFFAHHLELKIADGQTIATRLRPYLYDCSQSPPPKTEFLANVKRILTAPRGTTKLAGGVAAQGPRPIRANPQRETHRSIPLPGPKCAVTQRELDPTVQRPERTTQTQLAKSKPLKKSAAALPTKHSLDLPEEGTKLLAANQHKTDATTMGKADKSVTENGAANCLITTGLVSTPRSSQTKPSHTIFDHRLAETVQDLLDEEEEEEEKLAAAQQKQRTARHAANPTRPQGGVAKVADKRRIEKRPQDSMTLKGGANNATQGSTGPRRIAEEAGESEEAAFRASVDYLWAATALANAGDGGSRALTVRALVTQAARLGFARGVPYSIHEALLTLAKTPRPLPQPSTRATNAAEDDEIYYYREANGQSTLPQRIGGLVFRLGVFFDAPANQDLAQQDGVEYGRYRLTTEANEALLGVYLSRERLANVGGPRRQRLATAGRHRPVAPEGDFNRETYRHYRATGEMPARRGRQATQERDDARQVNRVRPAAAQPDNSEATQALGEEPEHHLNDRGGLLPGGPACPRDWYIYTDKPPHISQLAWTAVTKGTRAIHKRWLCELRAMPADLLRHRNLASAVIELIRRMAMSRDWAWSTTAKAMASVSGALQQLPLYTNQTRSIDLHEFAEWRKAMAAAQRFERERVAEPPSPITREQKEAAQNRSLRHRDPEAALFLEMMWAFSARAGDIRTLQCRDIRFTRDEPPPIVNEDVTIYPAHYGVVLTMRRGKGARFRGPYSIPSSLPLEYAVTLVRMMRERRSDQRLFSRPTETCTTIRTALRRENPLASLPSVRKGALRCMAARGMPVEELMTMSGHRRVDTLMRYLGFGHQLTVEAEVVQDNANAALYG